MVIAAVAALGVATGRVLIYSAREFAAEIVGAGAVTPGEVGEHRKVVGQAMVRRKEEAVVFAIGSIVCLLDIAVELALRGVGQISQAALAGI